MHWVLLAVLALLLIATASRFPKLAFSLLGVLVAVAAAMYYVTEPTSDGLPESFDVSQVEVSNVRMTPYYAGGFKAVGEIANHSSDHDITELVVRFSVEDCPQQGDSAEGCALVSEVDKQIRLHVPPGAVRTFESPVDPRRTSVDGKRRWRFKVIDVTARVPSRTRYE
jgi:hypothetical protein